MKTYRIAISLAFLSLTFAASAQQPTVLRDLDPLLPVTLTKEELQSLIPGSRIERVIASGNTHIWTNNADGKFIVSTDNSSTTRRTATAQGTWHISDDGRYCVLMEWKGSPEEWCRFFIRTSDGYYTTRSVKSMTEKVYKFNVGK